MKRTVIKSLKGRHFYDFVKAKGSLMKHNYCLVKRNKYLMKFNFILMKKLLKLYGNFENRTINLLGSSLGSALTDIWEGTLKKENFTPQVFFWLTISFIYLIDTVVLQGFGYNIDSLKVIKQYYRQGLDNPGQGIKFTFFTIIMGGVCSYVNLLIFNWMKHFDEPLDYERLPGYNFSRSHRFIYYLLLFFILGYAGSLAMSIIAHNYINLNKGILFSFGNLNNVNFATPLRQMPECLIIMWSFLGFDFYLKSIKGQMEWRDMKEKMEMDFRLDRQKMALINAEINNKKVENDGVHEENEQRQLALKLAVFNLGRVTAMKEEEALKVKERELKVKEREGENKNRELLLKEKNLELSQTVAINEKIAKELELFRADIDFFNSEFEKLKEENNGKDIEVKKLEEENKSKDIEVKKLEEENRAKDIQQRIFKSRFDAHLIINVLKNTHQRILPIHEEAADIIIRLSNLFRYLLKLTSNNNDVVSLSEDVEHILEYISLNRLTYNDNLDVYHHEITEQVKNETILKIERGILDEFITNSFKYAYIDVVEGLRPFIRFKMSLEEDNLLVFCVENTTLITDEPIENPHSSNSGLEIVKERLANLYPDNQIEYGSVDGMGRYNVVLKIRLNYEN